MERWVIFIILILLAHPVQGAVVGVSPSRVHFNNMVKDGYASRQVTVSTDSTQPLGASIIPEGEIADWIEIEKTSFSFSRDEPYSFSLVIRPPEDAKNGNYSGNLKITTDELAEVTSGAGSSVIAQVNLLIFIQVTGQETVACRAGAISTSSAEVGDPFSMRAMVHNDGNVRLRPKIIVDVWDQYRTRVLTSKTFLGDQILPTQSRQITHEIENDLDMGQYFAEIFIEECDVTEVTSFDIVAEGEIADSGELVGIKTNEYTYVDEPLPIAPIFRNYGQRSVLAQFKGEIVDLDTDKVVHVLESDRIEVNAKSTQEFPLYYIPASTGEYQITGRVVYNNKLTFDERSRVVRVVETEQSMSWLFYIMGYFIMGLVILIMIGKIRKAKRHKY